MPNRTFRIEFFVNTVNNNPITEGKTFVGFVNVTTDSTGLAQFNNVKLLSSATVGQFVSATATLLQNNDTLETSEYSSNIELTQGVSESTLSVAIFTKYCNNNDNPCG